jgi:hypothetical protein
MKLRELTLKENETLISTQGQQPHNFTARAQVGQGIEWPKASGTGGSVDVKRDEVEMPGEHHVTHHGDTDDGHGVSESIVNEAVGGNYLFHATGSDINVLKSIISNGLITNTSNQERTGSKLRALSFTRNWRYALTTKDDDNQGTTGIANGVIFVLDQSILRQKNKMQSVDRPADVINELKAVLAALPTAKTTNDLFKLIDGDVSPENLATLSKIAGSSLMNGRSFISAVTKPYLADKTNQQALADAQSKIKQAISHFVKTSAGKSIASAGGSTGSEYEEVILTPLKYVPFKDLGVVGYMINPAVDSAKQQEIRNLFAKVGIKEVPIPNSSRPGKDVKEGNVMEDEGGASPGATTSADIAVVAYPMTRGRSRRARRRAARAAVGQKYTPGPAYIGQGVFESSLATMRDYFAGNTDAKDPTKLATMRDYFTKIDKDIPETIQRIIWKVKNNVSLSPHEFGQYKEWMNNRRKEKITKEAHVLDHKNVIYRLDKDKPMTDTEVLVLGGAGRYTLGGLRDKARREADAMAADLKVEHGGSFRRAAENIKQLTNTLNTIVAAYNELKRIRSRGGRGSRGITDEESNFMRECSQRMTTLELYTRRVRQAQRIVEGIHRYLKEDKMNPEQASIIKGMFHLNTDPGYGFYRYAIHVAGNHGGDKVVLGPNAGPFAYAYTDEEDKMIRDAVKAITGKEPVELTGGKSKEPDFVNKNSTVPSIDWKKVK